MAEEYQYQKKRDRFGGPFGFDDTDTRIVGAISHNPNQMSEYVMRDPNKVVLDNIPQMSQHSVSYIFD